MFRCSLRGIITARQLSDALISSRRPMKYLWRKCTQRGCEDPSKTMRAGEAPPAPRPRGEAFWLFLRVCGGSSAVGQKENICCGALGGTRAEHTNKEETRGTAAVMQPLCCISAFLKEFLPSLSRVVSLAAGQQRPDRDWSHAEQKAFTFKSLQVLRRFV